MVAAGQPVLGLVKHAKPQIAKVQAGADAGNAADAMYLQPVQEVRALAPRFGFTGTFRVFPQVPVEITYNNKPYRVVLSQPLKQGPTGIWLMSRILPEPNQLASAPPGLKVGAIGHATADMQRIQAGADAKNPAYTWYLNPSQVFWRNMAQYGFTGPITTRQFIVSLDYKGKLYDFVLKQLATQGPKGVWLITEVRHYKRP